ncbi:MAG: MarR family winged helix-turn-helix transcriptional regulator [Flaviflexus sp.]|nr:MarR family winged helix-turn-helix transcriptional regulator [Flaviflexus sp.]
MKKRDVAPGMTGEVDEVDEIIAAWRRERGDVDLAPLAVFSRLLRLSKHLDRVRSKAFAAHGLEQWEFEMLSLLRRAGAPYQLPPSKVMAELMVPSGTLTHRINCMVERGYAMRAGDESDRRVKYVRATPEGIARVDAAMTDLLDLEKKMIAHMPPAERTELARLLKALLGPFEASRATPA